MVYMGTNIHRRGVAELGYRQGCGGYGTMRERNHRALEYSRRCRTRRWCRRLWVLSLILWAMLLAWSALCLTLPEAQESEEVSPPAVVQTEGLAYEEPVNLLVCNVTGYCACCTPYAHMNRNEAGQVLTASGRWVTIGEAVAVDPDIIPLGSTVTLGGKTYIAADTGVYGYTVDVLMSHEDAAQAGVVKAQVKWE